MTDKKKPTSKQEDSIVDQGLNHLAGLQGRYILKDKVPVLFEGKDSEYDAWVADDKNCVVKKTVLGKLTILTEFFGNLDKGDPDNHFWTIIGGESVTRYPNTHKVKYKTWDDALKGHDKIVKIYQEQNNE